MDWNPDTYARFADERARPLHDLLARVGALSPHTVVDLGCGPGDQTALLAQRWPDAHVTGIDSSPHMIEAAAAHGSDHLAFELGDAGSWSGSPDVVFTNAALQWIPDHVPLLRGWAEALPVGGWLAMQVPGNFDAPSHALMRALAESPRWADRLAGVLRHNDAVAEPQVYATTLLDAGLQVDAWETTYLHVLTGPDPVLNWVRGTGLRPVLAALDPAEGAEFEADYAASLREAYPATSGRTILPFRRIFAIGHRPA